MTEKIETAPWNPLAMTVWFTFKLRPFVWELWPSTVAVKVIFADCAPET